MALLNLCSFEKDKNINFQDLDNCIIIISNCSYFRTSSSLAVRWGLLSPVLPPGVGSPVDLREMSLTPWVIDVEPDAAVPGLFKIPFIASALKLI